MITTLCKICCRRITNCYVITKLCDL